MIETIITNDMITNFMVAVGAGVMIVMCWALHKASALWCAPKEWRGRAR